MKGALIGLFVGGAFFLLLYFRMNVWFTNSTIDINVGPTYYVLGYWQVSLLVFVVLGTFFGVGGVIASRFKSRLFWALTLLFLSVGIYYVVSILKELSESETVSLSKDETI